MGDGMRRLVTYGQLQYKSLVDQLEDDGFELKSLLEFYGSDQVGELGSKKKFAIDISSLMGLLSNPQLASSLELLVHQMPSSALFIGDENAVSKEAYMLRTMFKDVENCGLEADGICQEGERKGERSRLSANLNLSGCSPLLKTGSSARLSSSTPLNPGRAAFGSSMRLASNRCSQCFFLDPRG